MPRNRKIQPEMRRKINQFKLIKKKLTHMLKIADQDIKTVIVTVFQMFKK